MANEQDNQTEKRDAVPEDAAPEGSVRSNQNAGSQSDRVSLVDHGDQPKLTWKQKTMKHWKRFWWWYLIALIIILAIMLPIFFTLIIPRIVQNVVNGQELPVLGGGLYAVDATHVQLDLLTTLDAPLPIRLEPFELTLFNEDTPTYSPFLNMTVPQLHVHKNTDVTIPQKVYQIGNESELVLWFDQIFTKTGVDVSVEAQPHIDVYLGILHSTPSLRKATTVPGLNGLAGAEITDLTIMIPPDEKGHNIKGMLSLPNAGVLTLGLGDLTFNLMSGDLNFGLVDVPNVVLKPGNNSATFEGNLYLELFSQDLAGLLATQKIPLGHGYIELNATGNTTMVNGQHITYLETVLNSKSLTFRIPILTFLSEFISGLLNGDGTSILDALEDVIGNRTLIENTLNNFNQTQNMENVARGLNRMEGKRKIDIRSAMARNMLRWGLKTPKWGSMV